MRRLFFVAVGAAATKEQRDAFTTSLQTSPAGFWHHTEYSWLIVDLPDTRTAASLRDQLGTIMPGVTTIVLRVIPRDWAAFAPTTGHKWLHDTLADSLWKDVT
jgi:hypothetical protein